MITQLTALTMLKNAFEKGKTGVGKEFEKENKRK